MGGNRTLGMLTNCGYALRTRPSQADGKTICGQRVTSFGNASDMRLVWKRYSKDLLFMRLFVPVLSAAVLISLGACTTTGPTVVSAGATQVTYRIAPDRLEETRAAAQKYCADQGRRMAQLDSVTPTGDGQSVVAFTCQ
jgi:hypothetical protein